MLHLFLYTLLECICSHQKVHILEILILDYCYTYGYELNVEEDGTSHYDKLMEKLVELYHEIPWYCCDEIYESDKYLKQKEY